MNSINRRNFLGKTIGLEASSLAIPTVLNATNNLISTHMTQDDISLAQWALVEEVRAGKKGKELLNKYLLNG